MQVKEIMARDVACCSPADNLAIVAEMLWSHDCGALPVVDASGHVAGMITDRDVCIAVGSRDRKASELLVGEVMSPRLIGCDPEVHVLSALKMMGAEQVRRLPVVDATGTLQGMLSVSDVIRHTSGNGAAIHSQDVIRMLQAICTPGTPALEEEEVLVCTA